MWMSTLSGSVSLTSTCCTSGNARNRAATAARLTQKTLAPTTAAQQHVALHLDRPHLELARRAEIVNEPGGPEQQEHRHQTPQHPDEEPGRQPRLAFGRRSDRPLRSRVVPLAMPPRSRMANHV